MTKAEMILEDIDNALMHAFRLVDALEDEKGGDYIASVQWTVRR